MKASCHGYQSVASCPIVVIERHLAVDFRGWLDDLGDDISWSCDVVDSGFLLGVEAVCFLLLGRVLCSCVHLCCTLAAARHFISVSTILSHFK